MRLFVKKLLMSAAAISLLVGCSIYESGGRDAIENNKGGLVRLQGFSLDMNFYFDCSASNELPYFLKMDLYVLETEFETEGYTALAASKNNPKSLYVYLNIEDSKTHASCFVQNIKIAPLKSESLVQLGTEKIQEMLSRQSSR